MSDLRKNHVGFSSIPSIIKSIFLETEKQTRKFIDVTSGLFGFGFLFVYLLHSENVNYLQCRMVLVLTRPWHHISKIFILFSSVWRVGGIISYFYLNISYLAIQIHIILGFLLKTPRKTALSADGGFLSSHNHTRFSLLAPGLVGN